MRNYLLIACLFFVVGCGNLIFPNTPTPVEVKPRPSQMPTTVTQVVMSAGTVTPVPPVTEPQWAFATEVFRGDDGELYAPENAEQFFKVEHWVYVETWYHYHGEVITDTAKMGLRSDPGDWESLTADGSLGSVFTDGQYHAYTNLYVTNNYPLAVALYNAASCSIAEGNFNDSALKKLTGEGIWFGEQQVRMLNGECASSP